jgi:polyphosphate kinase
MVRNLDHRFEVTTPIKDESLQRELYDLLQIQLRDNCKARLINQSKVNAYKKRSKDEPIVRSQQEIYNYFLKKTE